MIFCAHMNTSRIWGFPYTGVVRNTQKGRLALGFTLTLAYTKTRAMNILTFRRTSIV